MSSDALLEFFAYSRQLEQEAGERYAELAEVMAAHHNGEVAAFFERMATEAAHHLAEVARLSDGRVLPRIEAWDFAWPGAEPPETPSYEAVHYRMSLAQAIHLALDNERAAERFYRDFARRSQDSEVQRLAGEFADEEAAHAAALEAQLALVPPAGDLGRIDDDEPVMPE
jgi:rubrerythrin